MVGHEKFPVFEGGSEMFYNYETFQPNLFYIVLFLAQTLKFASHYYF